MWSRDIPNQLIHKLYIYVDSLEIELSGLETTTGQLQEILDKLTLPEKLLVSHCRFDQANYCKTSLWKSDLCELFLVGWLPGQQTVIHDHNGSVGVVLAIKGGGVEIRYERIGVSSVRESERRDVHPGWSITVDSDTIHRLACPDQNGKRMVTLHLYAPPLGIINTYYSC